MVRRVGRIVIAAAAIGAAVLVGNAAVSVFHTAALRNESAAVLHSNELLLALDNVLSLVKDAESGQRGYVITGDPEYLAPYRAAVGVDPGADGCARAAGARRPGAAAPDGRRAAPRRRQARRARVTIGLRDRKGFDLARDVDRCSAPAAPRWRRCARPPPRWPRTRGSGWSRARPPPSATYRTALFSEALAALAALAALIGLSIVLRASPARPRRGRSADRRARRAPARHAREHRRRRDHDRPRRPGHQPQPRRRVAHRLACRGSAGAAAGGGLSHRQRVDARSRPRTRRRARFATA